RFQKPDWLTLGLDILKSDGPRGIRVENLCARAHKTKGSFYHHFKDRDDYVDSLLAFWEDMFTQAVIAQVELLPAPVDRLIALNTLTLDLDHGVERDLRHWAGTDKKVQKTLARVDKRRLDYVARLLMQAKNISSQTAIDLAMMNYATLVGFQQIYIDIHPQRRARIDKMFVDILHTLPDHHATQNET
ncbi:MAG TPA: TetR/AcrR family transcriptional regulator, partial [Hellea balneolensis]|nr:TetR/AcrR family transcriptional regulator [Hellea balneolensis]